MRKAVCWIILLVALVIGVFSGFQIYKEISAYRQGEKSYHDLEGYVSTPETESAIPEENTEETASDNTNKEAIQWPAVDFASLKELNPDCVAWIQIDGTKISYPVAQGEDNNYYLKHLFSGEWNNAGCIFLDYRVAADFSDKHSILYGHHMKDGTMFKDVTKYTEQSYYEAHPVGYLLTPTGNYYIEFFSGYVVPADGDAWKVDFASDAEYTQWLEAAVAQSCFTSEVRPGDTDQIITLSTCSYEFNDARFVLHGILRKNEL